MVDERIILGVSVGLACIAAAIALRRRIAEVAQGARTRRIGLMTAVAIAMITAATAVSLLLLGLTSLTEQLEPDRPQADERLDTDTFVSLARLSLYGIAGLGGVAALVVAYRRQITGETQAEEDQAVGFADAFGRGAEQLGSESATIRLAGAYALASLADRSPGDGSINLRRRQLIIDTLCGYLRLSSEEDHRVEQKIELGGPVDYLDHQWDTEVRQTILRLIKDHVPASTAARGSRRRANTPSWGANNFDLHGVIFREELDFEDVEFTGDVSFEECVFRKHASFIRSNFVGAASFNGAHARDLFTANLATFKGGCTFRGAVFDGDFSFATVTAQTGAWFIDAEFRGSANFRTTRSEGPMLFGRALFGGTADFSKVRAEWIDLTESQFRGKVDFSDQALDSGGLKLTDTKFDHAPAGIEAESPEN